MKNKGGSFLLVDGYNIIHSWDELKKLAGVSLEHARDKLIDILCDYKGYIDETIILVFDAHGVKGGIGTHNQHNNIYVVYTKEAETADHYIEKVVKNIVRNYNVSVATSDNLEQIIILAKGAIRISARELYNDIAAKKRDMHKAYIEKDTKKGNLLFDSLSPAVAEYLEQLRLQ